MNTSHCLNPIAQRFTECGLPSVTVTIDEARMSCEKCRCKSIERGVANYFKRHGLDRKYSTGLTTHGKKVR
jgi:hypothetical protein